MDKYKIIGILQLLLVVMVLAGFVLKSGPYWYVMDILIIIICGLCGLFLLIKRKLT
jgi:hypothetical protein